MIKIMTAIKTSGIPHLGNIINVILPTLSYIKKNKKNLYFVMIADLHSLTNYKNNCLNKYIYVNAAIWLAFNIEYNRENIFFYRQSEIVEILELFWFINCFYPFNRLKLFHIIKKNPKNNSNYNFGMFNYPILMASDILLYDIDKVIVGIDQLQHIEIARKASSLINNKIGKQYFKKPEKLTFYNNIFPGIDGKKMSKSLNNTINIFADKYILEKEIMSIYTINKNINEISYKEAKNTTLLKICKLVVDKNEYWNIKSKIKNQKIGFYNIKKSLLKYILDRFSKERNRFNIYLKKTNIIKNIISSGSNKSKKIIKKRIFLIKKALGLKI